MHITLALRAQSDPSLNSRDAYTVTADGRIDTHDMPDAYETLVRHPPLCYANHSAPATPASASTQLSASGRQRAQSDRRSYSRTYPRQRAMLAGRTLAGVAPRYWH